MKKIYIVVTTIIFLLILFVVLIILLLTGKIQDYIYLNINNDNKDQIIALLKEQEENMFNINNDIDLDNCYETIKRIEIDYLFPDGQNYIIYCLNTEVHFSLDNSNYNLSDYINKNGNPGFRFK